MVTVYGILMVTIAVLLFASAMVVVRKPDAPEWVRSGTMQTTVTLTCMTLLVWGAADLMVVGVDYSKHPTQLPVSLTQAVMIVANLVVFVLLWKRLNNVRRRIAQHEAAPATAVVPLQPAGDNDDSPNTPRTPRGVEPPKKRAA